MLLHNSYINLAIANSLHCQKSLYDHQELIKWIRSLGKPLNGRSAAQFWGYQLRVRSSYFSQQYCLHDSIKILSCWQAQAHVKREGALHQVSPFQTISPLRWGAGTVGYWIEWPGEFHSTTICTLMKSTLSIRSNASSWSVTASSWNRHHQSQWIESNIGGGLSRLRVVFLFIPTSTGLHCN